jgi:hypothetical protein
MPVSILKRSILTSGKFLSRQRRASIETEYSIGYSYHAERAGVCVSLVDPEHKFMEMRMTPDEAVAMAEDLLLLASKAREYQNE